MVYTLSSPPHHHHLVQLFSFHVFGLYVFSRPIFSWPSLGNSNASPYNPITDRPRWLGGRSRLRRTTSQWIDDSDYLTVCSPWSPAPLPSCPRIPQLFSFTCPVFTHPQLARGLRDHNSASDVALVSLGAGSNAASPCNRSATMLSGADY